MSAFGTPIEACDCAIVHRPVADQDASNPDWPLAAAAVGKPPAALHPPRQPGRERAGRRRPPGCRRRRRPRDHRGVPCWSTTHWRRSRCAPYRAVTTAATGAVPRCRRLRIDHLANGRAGFLRLSFPPMQATPQVHASSVALPSATGSRQTGTAQAGSASDRISALSGRSSEHAARGQDPTRNTRSPADLDDRRAWCVGA